MKNNWQFQVIEDVQAFRQLQDAWNQLLTLSQVPSPFLTWEWMYSWWEQYGQSNSRFRLHIVIARKGERILGIFPGMVVRTAVAGVPCRALQFIGSAYESSDYLEPIVHPEEKELSALMMEYVLENTAVDCWQLFNVLEERQWHRLWTELLKQRGFFVIQKPFRVCPYLPLQGDWEAYVQGLSKNMRYNLRRRSRKLLEQMGARVELVTESSQLDAAIDHLFSLHARRFRSKGERSIFYAEQRHRFHCTVAHRFLERDILRLFQLNVDGKTIAMLYCYEFGDDLLYFQAGLDPEWEKFSAGMVLMGQVIRYAFQKKLKRFDFMRGDEPYKFKWTSSTRNMITLEVPLNQRAHMAFAAREARLWVKEGMKKVIPRSIWQALKNKLTG